MPLPFSILSRMLWGLGAIGILAAARPASDQAQRIRNLESRINDLQESRYVALPALCKGRLTLTSATPIPSSDVTAATTIYFTPYQGAKVSLFDGTRWKLFSYGEISLALGTLSADTNYDIFLYDNAGVLSLELSAAWASATARTDSLVLQDGIYVKSGATTRRYLGTLRTTTTTTTEDSADKRFLWNYYNQVPVALLKTESAASWSYFTNTWRTANTNNANRLQIVIGIAGPSLSLSLQTFSHATLNREAAHAIAEDSTLTPHSSCMGKQAIKYDQNTFDSYALTGASLRITPAIGFHYYQWIELSKGAAFTLAYGNDTNLRASGLSGILLPAS